VPRVLCKDSNHLSLAIGSIIDNEGEGVILRKVASLYEHGKTSALLKLKARRLFPVSN
jgi:ATP-dependent DNA ligase